MIGQCGAIWIKSLKPFSYIRSARRPFLPRERNLSYTSGDEAYQAFLDAQEELLELQRQKEEEKSRKMYEAWKEASDVEKSPKATGVKVIQTLVKHQRDQRLGDDEIEHCSHRMKDSLKTAADKFCHPIALVMMGNSMLEQANNSESSEMGRDQMSSAMEYYHRACSAGAREGCFNRGSLLWTGWKHPTDSVIVIEPNEVLAMEAFERAISLGDADAMYFVGVQLLSEDSNPAETVQEGFSLIQQSAEQGHGGALYYLALLYLNGNEQLKVLPCSMDDFMQRLDVAVEACDPDALFLRGYSFYHGENGYELDYKRALDDYLVAADMKHADAAVSAGAILHQHHEGVAQDQKRAFQLYQLGGELGSEDGWRNVVACYVTGEGKVFSRQQLSSSNCCARIPQTMS